MLGKCINIYTAAGEITLIYSTYVSAFFALDGMKFFQLGIDSEQ